MSVQTRPLDTFDLVCKMSILLLKVSSFTLKGIQFKGNMVEIKAYNKVSIFIYLFIYLKGDAARNMLHWWFIRLKAIFQSISKLLRSLHKNDSPTPFDDSFVNNFETKPLRTSCPPI